MRMNSPSRKEDAFTEGLIQGCKQSTTHFQWLIKHIGNLIFSLIDFNLHPRLYAFQSILSNLKPRFSWRMHGGEKSL